MAGLRWPPPRRAALGGGSRPPRARRRCSGRGARWPTTTAAAGTPGRWCLTTAPTSASGSWRRERGSSPARSRFFEYIFLYKDAVMFQIEQVTKLCSKIALTEPWDPYDIPDNSTYEDQYYIGGPGDEIMVQEWSDRKPARKFESWVGVYTVKDCYPVQETYTKNYSVTTSTRFFDLQLGITDPSVFTPPSTCQEAQPIKMKDEC
ncbi:mammalian ependymin-related protein 1 isoform X2 [Terrapene carolina triunguis]|uniref:mammalian ependymin-related protein 1 isoform X2 n=1 Tax=Terrapene triunguis TaxID=2587831 RepID=UPI000CEFFA0F|nr:mammalian ependymin-related protein 1 isoform X2 [Terrapene carolina triunguis]